MSAISYLEYAAEAVHKIDISAIERASQVIADTIVDGKSIFAFGASHSFMLVEEMVYRTGGLMLVNPIYPHGMNLSVKPLTMTSKIERVIGYGTELLANSAARSGDLLLLISTSGRNAVTIDMAILAKKLNIKTIAITALAYTESVSSRHPSGKKLSEVCDLVIDNGAPYGDAVVEIPGFAYKVGPLSSVTGCAIVNALTCETVRLLVSRGVTPPVFVSANTDQGDAHNAVLLQQHRERIHYL